MIEASGGHPTRVEAFVGPRGGNFAALENCGAIATFVANFCRADFGGSRYGKP